MSKKNLPQLEFNARDGVDFEIAPSALQRWNAALRAEDKGDEEASISIYEAIGNDGWGGGITAGRIAGALRRIGNKDITVNINSPGGSVFEGIAIYNLLRAHPKNVKVRVVGLAASAASVIAMAGDTVEMGQGAFLMIHNVWTIAIGNRNDLRAAADVIEPIDRALADLYAARSGHEPDEIGAMMDKETWLGAQDAIDQGFADALMPEAAVTQTDDKDNKRSALQARAELQAALAKAGYSRSRQRELLKEFSGMPGAAAASTMPRAGDPAPNAMPRAGGPEPQAALKPNAQGSRMDITTLKAEHPELYAQVLNEGRQSGRKEGADDERARIAAIDAAAVPGHEALTTKAKAEGLSAGDYALQVMAAEKVARENAAQALAADAPKPAAAAAPADPAGSIKRAEYDALPLAEQRAKVKAGVKIVD